MLQTLRTEVYESNLELVRRGPVIYTFGNASAVSPEERLIVIKPSGVPYDQMRPGDMVITDLDCRVVEGSLRSVLGLADTRSFVPRIPLHWRRRAHPFPARNRLGSGLPRNSLPRDHLRRLFLRIDTGDRGAPPR